MILNGDATAADRTGVGDMNGVRCCRIGDDLLVVSRFTFHRNHVTIFKYGRDVAVGRVVFIAAFTAALNTDGTIVNHLTTAAG